MPQQMSDTDDRRPRPPGFTLIEVLVATFIMLLMALMVAAIVPVATRGTHQSRSYNQAVLLAQRKIDQFQEQGQDKVGGTSILQVPGAPTLVDNNGANVGTTDDGYLRFPFTQCDKLATVLGPGAVGEAQTRSWGGASVSGNKTLLGVRVVITWREGGSARKSEYRVSTVVTKMPIK